jgi:hypothetical protein
MARLITNGDSAFLLARIKSAGMDPLQFCHLMDIRFIFDLTSDRLLEAHQTITRWSADQCAAEDAEESRREQRGDR